MQTGDGKNAIEFIGITVTDQALETEIDGHSFLALNTAEGRARMVARLQECRALLRITCEDANGRETSIVQDLQDAGLAACIARANDVLAQIGTRGGLELTPQMLAEYGARTGVANRHFARHPVARRETRARGENMPRRRHVRSWIQAFFQLCERALRRR